MYTNKKLIVFDLDGTLIDSMPQYSKIASAILQKEYGLSAQVAEKEYYRTSGVPFSQQLEVLFPLHEKNAAAAAEFEQKKIEYIKHHGFDLSPAAHRALMHLQDQGLLLAISTSNSPDSIEYVTNNWSFQFDVVLAYEGKDFQKGLSHFSWLAEHFNLSLNDMLFIGDSLDDYHLAKSAGVDFIAILSSFKKEDFINLDPKISTIQDIAELIKF